MGAIINPETGKLDAIEKGASLDTVTGATDKEVLYGATDGTVASASTFVFNSTTTSLAINQTPGTNNSAPSYSFGDGDTGFYEDVDDSIAITIDTVKKYIVDTSNIKSAVTDGFSLSTLASSNIQPTLRPSNVDNNTGMGWAGPDILSLVTGGKGHYLSKDSSDATITTSPSGLKNHKAKKELADDATYTIGAVTTMCQGRIVASNATGQAYALFYGTGAAITIASGNAAANSDSDTNMCLYFSGSDLILKNRLGDTYSFLINVDYY